MEKKSIKIERQMGQNERERKIVYFPVHFGPFAFLYFLVYQVTKFATDLNKKDFFPSFSLF
jgi:hypothetical protein